MEIQVLNEDLFLEGIVTQWNSLIWANRYAEQGDCELYLEANTVNLDLLRIGRFLKLNGVYAEAMVCVIRKIEIQTDVENGNYLIVSGEDCKSFLKQRIIMSPSYANGGTEAFIRAVVSEALIDPQQSPGSRVMERPHTGELFRLGTNHGLTSRTVNVELWQNLQQFVEQTCKANGWGYRVTLQQKSGIVNILEFEVYKGDDRSASVGFTTQYKNLSASDYVEDCTDMGNVVVVEGEDVSATSNIDPVGLEYFGHYTMVSGDAQSIDRWEKYIKSSNKRQISYSDLTTLWPDGSISIGGSTQYYRMASFVFPVVPGMLRTWIENELPRATFTVIDGVTYCTINNATLATVPSASPAASDQCTLSNLAYLIILANDGAKEYAKYGRIVSFDGTLIPNGIFKYRQGFFLGDIVTVQNELGISTAVRIVEAVDVWDTSGHRTELKYEKMTEN